MMTDKELDELFKEICLLPNSKWLRNHTQFLVIRKKDVGFNVALSVSTETTGKKRIISHQDFSINVNKGSSTEDEEIAKELGIADMHGISYHRFYKNGVYESDWGEKETVLTIIDKLLEDPEYRIDKVDG